MRIVANPTERVGARLDRVPDDFAILFDELARPVDSKTVNHGFEELHRWLGSPSRQWQAGVRH